MFTWAVIRSLPWRFIAPVAGVIALCLLASHAVHDYGVRRFADGKAVVQLQVDRITAKANADARAAEKAHQEKVNALDADYQSQIAQAQVDLAAVRAQYADAVAVGDRLRSTVRAITALHARTSADTTGGSDGATQALGDLLESCSGIAEQNAGVAVELAGEAERLALQLRQLQSFAEVNE